MSPEIEAALKVLGGVGVLAGLGRGGVGVYRWWDGRREPRVTFHRDLSFDDCVKLDRLAPWAGDTTKRYVVVEVQNARSSKPFRLLPATLEPVSGHARPVMPRNTSVEGVELQPHARTFYMLEMEEARGARLTIRSHGWERTYRI